MTPSRSSKLLFIAWLAAAILAGVSVAIFMAGVRRDTRAGDPSLAISLGTPSNWVVTPFRVWRDGPYALFISTVNHDEDRVGARFDGQYEVVVRRPDGTALFERTIGAGGPEHVLPSNYGDTRLATLTLERSVLRPWTLEVRVTRSAAVFAGVPSELKLWRERPEIGMGGLASYVMIVPAGLFAIVALLVALALDRQGSTTPLRMTAAGLLILLVWAAR